MIRILSCGAIVSLLLCGVLLDDYLWMKSQRREVDRLMAEAQTQQEELSTLYTQAREIDKLLAQWRGLRKKVEFSLPPQRRPSARNQQYVDGLGNSLTSLQNELVHLIAATPSEWPVYGRVSSGVGIRLDPWTKQPEFHAGLDIPKPMGTPIRAPADGTVHFAGTANGTGRVVILDHGQSVVTKYAHLSKIFVKKGQMVRKGDEIAAVGNTGKSTSSHLHYEMLVNGVPIDPRRGGLLQSHNSLKNDAGSEDVRESFHQIDLQSHNSLKNDTSS